jgi:hypothetical protein
VYRSYTVHVMKLIRSFKTDLCLTIIETGRWSVEDFGKWTNVCHVKGFSEEMQVSL